MKKILLSIPSLNIGGAELIVKSLAVSLRNEGSEVTVMVFNHSGVFIKELEDSGIKIKSFRARIDPKYNIFLFIRILLFLARSKFDVIHTNLGICNSLVGLAAVLTRCSNIIMHEHGGILKKNVVHLEILKLIQGRARIIYISKSDSDYFNAKDGIDPKNTIIIENPLLIKSDLRIDSERKPKVIGMVGRLEEFKGHVYALQAFRELDQEGYRFKYILVGDGKPEIKRNLFQYAAQNSLELEITGFTQNVENYYKKIDVFVHPSLSEGFGLVIIEAMSFGIPVIASAVGGIINIINDKETGILTAPRSVKEIKNAVIELYNNDNLRMKIASNGYALAREKYSYSNYFKIIKKLYGMQ